MEKIDDHYLLSLGFRDARISTPEKTLRQLRSTSDQVQVQLVKAGLVGGLEHLRFAALNALHSFKGKSPRSKSLAVEFLLYISCQRQISKAIQLLGVEPGDREVLLVALSESQGELEQLAREAQSLIQGNPDDGLAEISSKRKSLELQQSYGISRTEMEAARFAVETDSEVLKRLIVERSALLAIKD